MDRAQDLFGALMFAVLVVGNFAGMAFVAHLLGRPRRNPVKDEPFECGIPASEPAPTRLPMPFYMAGLLLLVFDVQAVFLLPWAAGFRELGPGAFAGMLAFTGFLMCGYLYALGRGAFRWR
jgi:NADH-quinone oxidoreductase subunit A